MTVQPIPSSALSPAEYIPAPQDADRYLRHVRDRVAGRRVTLDTMIAEHEPESDVAEMRADIEQEERDGHLKVEEMRRRFPEPLTFLLSIPSTIERDQINSRLVSLGLSQVTQEQIRATMIEELFAQDWALPSRTIMVAPSFRTHSDATQDAARWNESVAEEIANFLDGVWLREQAHNVAIERWQEQEVERVLDEAKGAPIREREDLPPKLISVRETARMRLLIDEMMASSQRLRDLAAQNMDFSRQNAILLVRMHVLGVLRGGAPVLSVTRNPVSNALSEEDANRIRELVDDQPSWLDLVGYIDKLYRLDGWEVKNSDSPPAKLSPGGGSTGPSAGPADSDGNLTGSNTGLPPVDASATIIGTSSASTSASGMEPAPTPPSNFQTDAG